MNTQAVDAIRDELLDHRFRGFQPSSGLTIGDVGAQGWSTTSGDMLLPVATIRASALEHNIQTMADWCTARNVSLAPHGKTTMAPQIFAWQLAAGAWGVTAATASHVRMYRHFGVQRIVVANQVVEPRALRWLVQQLGEDSEFELVMLADSIEVVERLSSAASHSGGRRIPVLVELGYKGGRMGVRSVEEALTTARAVAAAPGLRLAGVEAFEGIAHTGSLAGDLRIVDGLVDGLAEIVMRLVKEGLHETQAFIVSAGGSGWFDRVATVGSRLSLDVPVHVVLRSGCYVTHDHGHYADFISPERPEVDIGLRPALEVVGAVLSVPESALAIVGVGKRDVGSDIGMPVPLRVRGADGRAKEVDHITVFDLNDQHAYLRTDGSLAVGDIITFGISHPCTAFDKWPLIALVDDEDVVVDAIRTFF